MKKSVLALAAAFAVGGAQASLLIDDFGTFASTTDFTGGGTSTVISVDYTATDLTGADRNITNLAFGTSTGGKIETIVTGGPDKILSISANSLSLGGTSTLMYDGFGTVDFASKGSAIILDVLKIDTGVTVEMFVNGTSSTSGKKTFGDPGVFFVKFTDFTDPTQFTKVSDIKLVFSGDTTWDGNFKFLRTDDPPTVPVPATLALMGLGLLGLGVTRRRKS